MPPQAGTSSIGRTTPGCTPEMPSDLEKFALRTLGGCGMATLATPNPFQQGICPHQKRGFEVLHTHSLKSSRHLGLGGPTFSHTLGFLQRAEHLSGHFKMATKFS